MPRIRGRLYSSCASSTWSLPSALTACWAKMSRISCVRSTTRAWRAFSSVRCWEGLSSSSTSSTSAPRVAVFLLQLLDLPLADVRARVGQPPVLDDPAHGLDSGRPRKLLELGELVRAVGAGSEHGKHEPALGLGRPGAIGLSHRHPPFIMTPAMPASDLAARTLELVNVPSESRREAAAMELVRSLLPGEPLYDDGEAIVWGDAATRRSCSRGTSTRCPPRKTSPGWIADDAVHGLGASDMKGGVAVMLELARDGAPGRYVFFTREEVPIDESPLPGVFASGVLAGVELAVVLEPTDGILHAGCLGNLQARDRLPRRERALGAAVDGAQRDSRARRGSGAARRARAARGRARRSRFSRGAERGACRRRDRGERRAGRVPRRSSTSATRPAARATKPRRGYASSSPAASSRSSTTLLPRRRRSTNPLVSGCASSCPTSRRSRRGRRSRSSPSRGSTRSTTARVRRRRPPAGRADPDREPARGVRDAD